jgi:predicted DNA-binding transcriptional regulator YafY
LIARVDDSIRTYRISRVQNAESFNQTFARPTDFDLAAYWEASSTQFRANLPQYPATIRIEASLYEYMRAVGRYARVVSAGPPDERGWMELEMLFEGEHSACEHVLSFGPRIEVVAPSRLRELVIETARQIIAHYNRDP